ncbi:MULTISPECIES: hypothetical protein [Pseudovibrio]|uniref:hypothetical protein n=1 Tax=Stappiaceae TaxID=2821832 RepID=UPI002365AFD5|nr:MULTISPECIES: hypothetical protein [Pseudovibrio]MDD7909193.1 hypothetical protein [Pseudovibrio exalbescens]MDX5595261.1 hypothetical protein [Pseudovibrio sp. SPO723]
MLIVPLPPVNREIGQKTPEKRDEEFYQNAEFLEVPPSVRRLPRALAALAFSVRQMLLIRKALLVIRLWSTR